MSCGPRVKRDGTHKARVYLAQKRGNVAPVAPGEAGAHVPTRPSLSTGYTAVKLVVAHAAHYEHDLADALRNPGEARASPLDITQRYLAGASGEHDHDRDTACDHTMELAEAPSTTSVATPTTSSASATKSKISERLP